ncbi:hypothetical protein R54767_00043 [Paraburkholderia gardini]|uniref:GtrA-like protein n=2 Tax=Paraburkholderia gardini TaxID=2823469 RepID=A0ABM8TXC0_9BURK|nr:hypothetical protein R54767_00043 [Paraburkholderia gardini]
MAMSFGGIVNYATYCALIATLPKYWFLPLLSVAAGSVAGLMVNFLIARHWVYKTSH